MVVFMCLIIAIMINGDDAGGDGYSDCVCIDYRKMAMIQWQWLIWC